MNNRTKLLLEVADGLRRLADSLTALVEEMGESGAGTLPEPTITPEPITIPTVILEEVRAILAEKSRSGKTEAVKALIQRFGADRLSAVDPARFPELLHAAEAL